MDLLVLNNGLFIPSQTPRKTKGTSSGNFATGRVSFSPQVEQVLVSSPSAVAVGAFVCVHALHWCSCTGSGLHPKTAIPTKTITISKINCLNVFIISLLKLIFGIRHSYVDLHLFNPMFSSTLCLTCSVLYTFLCLRQYTQSAKMMSYCCQ